MRRIPGVPEMGTFQIARKDFMDTVRRRQLYFFAILFAVVGGGVGYFAPEEVAEILLLPQVLLVPLAGLTLTQQSIVEKHQGRELVTLLGLPFSRRAIVLGTFLGRFAVFLVALASMYVSVIVLSLSQGGSPDYEMLVAGVPLMIVMGAVFLSIGLGISTATTSTAFASGASILAYLVFIFQIWQRIPDLTLFLLNGFEFPQEQPFCAEVFEQLSPLTALRNTVVVQSESLAANFPFVTSELPTEPPVYMTPRFAVLVVLGWLIVPPLLGYLAFSRRDL